MNGLAGQGSDKQKMIASFLKGNHEPPVCEVCGNRYDKAFEVRMGGKTHIFDSFECAIQALAPTCAHCGSEHGIRGVEDRGVPERVQIRS